MDMYKKLCFFQGDFSQPAEGRLRPKIIDGGRSVYLTRDFVTIGKSRPSPTQEETLPEIL